MNTCFLDLGTAKSVFAISSWSFNQNNKRGRQLVAIYGSIDTASRLIASFTAASLRAPLESSPGLFRWIVWATAPVIGAG